MSAWRSQFRKQLSAIPAPWRSDRSASRAPGQVQPLARGTPADTQEASRTPLRDENRLTVEVRSTGGSSAPRLASAVALEPLTVQALTADEFRAFVAQH